MSSPDELQVFTGLPDDVRRPLKRDDPKDAALFQLAEQALLKQGDWSDERHQEFWLGLLPRWPRPRGRGARRTQERLAELADYCAGNLMLTPAETAEILEIEQDSLRRKRYFEVGDEAMRQEGLDRDPDAWRPTRAPIVVASATGPDCLIARVVEYQGQYDGGRLADQKMIDVLWEAVFSRQREMFASGELVSSGGRWVRNGDRDLANREWRRLMEQGGCLPGEIDAIERYDRARGLIGSA